MSHDAQMRFFAIVVNYFPEHFAASVLDVGSLDINGGPHSLISPSEYVGVDIDHGPNVNVVARGESLTFADERFDVTMSSECFEHNPMWRETLENMIRMTKPSGLVVFSCATTGRSEHGTTRSDGGSAAPLKVAKGEEYYRNVRISEVKKQVDLAGLSTFRVTRDYMPSDLYFVGLKAPAKGVDLEKLDQAWNAVRKNRSLHRRPAAYVTRMIFVAATGDAGKALFDKTRTRMKS